MVDLQEKEILKSMLCVNEMISKLKEKNIKFEKITEEETKDYLRYNNNYYNITAYKNNFLKYPTPAGKFEGKYIDLDFAYLKDLAIIDYRLRIILFEMIIDIEYYLKLKILNTIEKLENEDGYKIVNLYLEKDYNSKDNAKRLHKSILKKVGSEYYQKIFSKYDIDADKRLENIPIWEFLEIITFGELVRFYDFYTLKYNLVEENIDVFMLRDIVKLRNAVAHNTCILNDLGNKNNHYPLHYNIVKYLNDCNIGKTTRKFKLSNCTIRQITYTLYMFNEIVTSKGIKENMKIKINNLFFKRIPRNKSYYKNNEMLKSVYKYFYKIIKNNYSYERD